MRITQNRNSTSLWLAGYKIFCEAVWMCVQWSLGVAVWELMTLGLEPYADVPPEKLASYLRRGFRLAQPLSCSSAL